MPPFFFFFYGGRNEKMKITEISSHTIKMWLIVNDIKAQQHMKNKNKNDLFHNNKQTNKQITESKIKPNKQKRPTTTATNYETLKVKT